MKNTSTLHITAIIPFYNEEAFLQATLDSWATQVRLPDHIIMIDNASKDGSGQIAKSFAETQKGRIPCTVLFVEEPGKVNALNKAQEFLLPQENHWASFCDADTIYPVEYLQHVESAILANPQSVAIMAIDLPNPPQNDSLAKSILNRKLWAAKCFPKKCHTGGFGQTFKVIPLLNEGGFNREIWPFVLMDHEIVQRLLKHGKSIYNNDLWCLPSQRRGDRGRVRWTVWERFLYFVHPNFMSKWFFQSYLRAKFTQRKLGHLNLREQPWKKSN